MTTISSVLKIPEQNLLKALELARLKRGFCFPNPSVGAVIAAPNGEIISTGYHEAAGCDHAEVMALKKINYKAKGMSLFVTLEPCCHWGKTPPCTDSIINAGIANVFYSYKDPNPLVVGKSISALEEQGISCHFIPVSEINDFYQSYQYWNDTKTPQVTAKIALTLNGAIAGKQGERITITGTALNEFTHLSRKHTDAILTTSRTIKRDDPLLNSRYKDEVVSKPIYILDSQLTIPKTANIFKSAKSITLLHRADLPISSIKQMTDRGARCIPVDYDQQGLNLEQVLTKIGEDGVHDLWVEAGGKCFAAFINAGLVQRALIYIAPQWLEQGQIAFPNGVSFKNARIVQWRQFAKDVMCEMRLNENEIHAG